MAHQSETTPLDAGDWLPWRFVLHAAGGACGGRALLLALAGLFVAEFGAAVVGWFAPEAASAIRLPARVDGRSLQPLQLLIAGAAGQADFAGGFLMPLTHATVATLAAGLWRVAVWTLFGAAIARLAALHLTLHELPSPRRVLRRAAAAWGPLFLGLAAVLGVVGALAGLVWLLHLLLYVLPAVLVWPMALLIAVPAAALLAGLIAGWPLMIASSAAERPDPFDAVSCGFAYAYQRPLRLVVYAAVAGAVGALVGALLQVVTRLALGVIDFAFVDLEAIDAPAAAVSPFWFGLLARLPLLYHASYFWFAAIAIYLLLRRDIDEKQADEVFLDDDPQPALGDEAALGGDQPVGA